MKGMDYQISNTCSIVKIWGIVHSNTINQIFFPQLQNHVTFFISFLGSGSNIKYKTQFLAIVPNTKGKKPSFLSCVIKVINGFFKNSI
jgi:hypothetical protein